MKIVFFAKGDRRLPSSRTRVYLVADYLNAHGHHATVHQVVTRPWWNLSWCRVRDLIHNARVLFSLQRDEILFLQRTVHQVDFIMLVLLWRFVTGRSYVFDFDDAIFTEKGHADFKTSLLIRHAMLVLPSSHSLLEYAAQYNSHAFMLATSIDTDTVYVPRTTSRTENKVVIGWIGSPGHLANMRLLVAPVTKLVQSGVPFRLRIVGGGDQIPQLFVGIPGLDLSVVAIPPESPVWKDPKNYVEHIQMFDIGLVPLEKTELNAGKDSHKIKEYMGCEVATVATAWGEHFYMIEDGTTGLLVDSDEEWVTKLSALVTNEVERARLARNGREYICRESSLDSVVSKMLSLVETYVVQDV